MLTFLSHITISIRKTCMKGCVFCVFFVFCFSHSALSIGRDLVKRAENLVFDLVSAFLILA